MTSRTALGLVVGLIGIGVWRVAHPSGEIGTDLGFGWIGYLGRVLPNVTVRWDGIWTFLGGLVAASLVAHFLISGRYRGINEPKHLDQLRWRFRWTAALMGFVVLMFAAGTSMVGITHQIAWLLSAEEPLFGEDLNYPWTSQEENLRSMGHAVQNSTYFKGFPTREVMSRNGEPQSWILDLLPYLRAGYMLPDVATDRPWDDPVNAKHFKSLVPELLNPEFRNAPLRDQNGYGLTHYAGNSELFERHDEIPHSDALFSQSNLLLIGEANSEFEAWGRPGNSRNPSVGINTQGGFGGPSGSGGALFVMADGSLRLISEDIDPQVLKSLSRPASE